MDITRRVAVESILAILVGIRGFAESKDHPASLRGTEYGFTWEECLHNPKTCSHCGATDLGDFFACWPEWIHKDCLVPSMKQQGIIPGNWEKLTQEEKLTFARQKVAELAKSL